MLIRVMWCRARNQKSLSSEHRIIRHSGRKADPSAVPPGFTVRLAATVS